MSDTPETDAELHGINAVCKEERKLDAMTSHARKLERERDEARRECKFLWDERDEARELLASEKITRNHIIKRSVEVERERDEARELIDDIWITATSDHRFIMPPSKKQIPQHIEGIIKAYDKAHDDWTPEEIKTLMRERDEALEKAERYRIEANAMMMQRDEWSAMCGRYKQERDEALMDRANGYVATMTINHYERILRERDEAREKYDTLATEHMLVVNKLCKERDDARDALSRIDEIFCDGEDTHDDWMKMGSIAKDYFKGLE